jgi:hypothetical protein
MRFRVANSSGTMTERMRIDGGTGNVGIGTNAPENALHVYDSSTPVTVERIVSGTNTRQGMLDLVAKSSGNMADGFGPQINFKIEDDAGTTENTIFGIAAIRDGADNSGALVLRAVTGGSESESMRIDDSGNVGIGTAAPYSAASGRKILTLEGTSNVSIELAVNGARKGYIYHNATDITIENETSGGDITLTPHSTGDVNIGAGNLVIGTSGKGVLFHPHDEAASSPGSDSNLLDDYEEGTWVASLTSAGGTAPTIYGPEDTMTYTKIGRAVFIGGQLGTCNCTDSTGALTLNGFPFTMISGLLDRAEYTFMIAQTNTTIYSYLELRTSGGGTTISVNGVKPDGTRDSNVATTMTAAGNFDINIVGYFIAA